MNSNHINLKSMAAYGNNLNSLITTTTNTSSNSDQNAFSLNSLMCETTPTSPPYAKSNNTAYNTNGFHSPTSPTGTTSNFITSTNLFNLNAIVPPSNFVKSTPPAQLTKLADLKCAIELTNKVSQQTPLIENVSSNIFDSMDCFNLNGDLKSAINGLSINVDDNEMQHFWDARMKDIADAMTYLELI